MPFLHPLLLWALPLAALPILIHLFSLRRVRSIELPTFRFLFDTYIQQRRRLRFLEALLAALRTAFLLLFVVALCRPFASDWAGWLGSGGGRDIVFLVDASASVGIRQGGVSSLDRAKSLAGELLERIPADDRITLIRVAGKPQEIFGRFRSGAESVRPMIEAIEPAPTGADWLAAFRHISPQGPNPIENPKVFVFTDGQNAGWNEAKEHGLQTLLGSEASLTVIDTGDREPIANRAVIGDPPERQLAVVGLPVRLRPRVSYRAQGEAVQVPVGVVIEDQEIGKLSFGLKAGETASRELVYTPKEPGLVRGRFEIPPDKFPADDTYLFTLNVQSRIKALIVNGAPNGDPFENETLYLRTALSVAGEELDEQGRRKPKDGVPRPAPAAAEEFKPDDESARIAAALEIREVKEWEFHPRNFRGAHVVILCNVGGINDLQIQQLKNLIQTGTGLLVFPGDRVNKDTVNRLWFGLGGENRERVLPCEMLDPKGDPNKPEDRERIATLNLGHPILSVFADPNERPFSTVRVGRHFPIRIDPKSGAAAAIMELSNGRPLILEGRLGQGVVLFSSVPVSAKWSNLPLRPEFVPLMLRMVAHAAGTLAPEIPSAVVAGKPAELRMSGLWTSPAGEVTDPVGRRTALAFKNLNAGSVAPLDNLDQKGYYQVEATGGSADDPKNVKLGTAVNLDPGESDFRRISGDEFKTWFPGVAVEWIDGSKDAGLTEGSLSDRQEFWRPIMMVACFIIAAELLLCTLAATPENPDLTLWGRLRNLMFGRSIANLTGAGQGG